MSFLANSLRRPFVANAARFKRFYSAASFAKDIETVDLAFDKHSPASASSKEPIVFLHGLFGSKVNNRTVSKALAGDLNRDVYCLDLRNHGDSPQIARHDYPSLAADVEAFIDNKGLGPSIIIGHSMGAKTAMAVSLRRPDIVKALIPVDNAPIDAQLNSSFPRYARAMKRIEASNLKSSKDAFKIMGEVEEDLSIQQFLLSNLKKAKGESYKFRIPVDILSKSLDFLSDFPFSPEEARYLGPTMFIRGTESH
ncbi:hypothetical protein DV495_003955 [Geotrichum candidum]|nr:hypothetical protein DV454_004679 [Geotrichum candidum]KAI9214140.1 hypothetical protein DS838_000979 [Geotrichum bryndzae]KAF5113115.1 hypothetical protein DV452_003785 [Geotrichum candidum]KAF5124424.1 hypothetical protein DV495_003955 [Geotrichum candidum]KAF7500213.1 hypothetical protein DV113_001761 [Geotrichum candidum]